MTQSSPSATVPLNGTSRSHGSEAAHQALQGLSSGAVTADQISDCLKWPDFTGSEDGLTVLHRIQDYSKRQPSEAGKALLGFMFRIIARYHAEAEGDIKPYLKGVLWNHYRRLSKVEKIGKEHGLGFLVCLGKLAPWKKLTDQDFESVMILYHDRMSAKAYSHDLAVYNILCDSLRTLKLTDEKINCLIMDPHEQLFDVMRRIGNRNEVWLCLWRGLTSQPRWTLSGEVYYQQPEDPQFCSWFRSSHLDAFKILKARGRLCRYSYLRVAPNLDQELDCNLQAFLIICQAFPFDDYLEMNFGELGRRLICSVFHALKQYNRISWELKPHQHHAFVSMLLSASKFRDQDWKERVLTVVADILKKYPDAALDARLRSRSHVVKRLWCPSSGPQPKYPFFGLLLEPYVAGVQMERDLSRVEHCMHLDLKDDALAILTEIGSEEPEHLSTFQRHILLKRDLVGAKFLCFEGDFSGANRLLRSVLSKIPPNDVKLISAIGRECQTRLAQVHCEIGQYDLAISAIEYEIKMDQRPEVNGAMQILPRTARLRVSLGEIQLCASRVEEALFQFQMVDEFTTAPSQVARITMLRREIGLARAYQLRLQYSVALRHWEKSLLRLEQLDWKGGFYKKIIYMSMAICCSELHNVDAEKWLAEARATRCTGHFRFAFPGFATMWRNHVYACLEFNNTDE